VIMAQENGELRRILDMVEAGKISPEEAERLIGSLKQESARMRCPYCAESIPANSPVCPECATPLASQAAHTSDIRGPESGFFALSGLGKFLVLYLFAVCTIIMLSLFRHGVFAYPSLSFQALMAGFGIVAGVLICKGNRAGWTMALWWAGLQIIPVTFDCITPNKQLFHVGVHFTANCGGLGLNLVGVLLLILFFKAKPHDEPMSWNGG